MRIKSFLVLLCLALCSTVIQAQEKKAVTGVVQDSKGNPLSGATVREAGTQNAVTSNAKGAFSIQVKSNATLLVSFVGFAEMQVKTGSSTNYVVTLQESQGGLQEVVVTSLGISREKKALGYATTTIKAEDITRTASPNFATALYGKAPGVRIAATPGGATSAVNIQIRGVNSITGSSQPLIVLDGVPIRNGEAKNNDYFSDQRIRGNGLLDINPDDIDNISILKGASAAALYGSEAVNGVVLITTKNGGKGKKGLSVDASINYSMDNVAYLPRYQDVRGPGMANYVPGWSYNPDDAGWLYTTVNGATVRTNPNASVNFGPLFDGQPALGWDGIMRPYVAQKDNYKNFFQTGRNSDINVALAQSSENSSSRFSLTRQTNQGVSIGSENVKNIANLNINLRLHKNFTTDVMVNYINQKTHNRPYQVDRMINNFTGMIGRFDDPSWYFNRYKTSKGYRYVTGAATQSLTPSENIIYNGFKGDIADYVWRLKEYNEDEFSNRVIASVTNNWQIIKGLKLRTRLSTDFTSMRTESRQTTTVPLAFGYSGYFGLSSYNNTILYGDALLSYTKKINNDIDVNLMAGYTANSDKSTSLSRGTNGGLSVENYFDLAASVSTASSGSSRTNIVKDAVIGTANISYKNYLFAEATVRRDRTSTMNPNKNSFVYPSVNASFLFSDAFKLPAFISYGKVRASWGVVGNYPAPYLANVVYSPNTLGVQAVGGSAVLYTTIPGSFGNDGIKPEEKHEIEFGLEARFFKNRVNFEASYYNGQIVDQILPLTLPSTSGATSILTNIGTLRNKGFEMALSGTPIQNKRIRWETGINIATNKNMVEKIAPGLTNILHADYDGNAAQLVSLVGRPMGDILVHPVQQSKTGQPIVDPNGMYHVDPNTMITAGNAMPKVVGGFFNSLSYKGISLDMMADFRFGGYVMPTGIYWMISRGLLKESLNYMDKEHGGLSYYIDGTGKRIQTSAAAGPAGEKVRNDGILLPGVKADGSPNDYIAIASDYYNTVYNWGGPQYSPNTRYELYVQKNTYIKMREISIGYQLPASIGKYIGAKKVQVSVFGRNLFYLYRTIKDIDAEQTTAGSRWFQNVNNAGNNPSTKSYGVMLKASF